MYAEEASVDMSVYIHEKSVDMDMDMDEKFYLRQAWKFRRCTV